MNRKKNIAKEQNNLINTSFSTAFQGATKLNSRNQSPLSNKETKSLARKWETAATDRRVATKLSAEESRQAHDLGWEPKDIRNRLAAFLGKMSADFVFPFTDNKERVKTWIQNFSKAVPSITSKKTVEAWMKTGLKSKDALEAIKKGWEPSDIFESTAQLTTGSRTFNPTTTTKAKALKDVNEQEKEQLNVDYSTEIKNLQILEQIKIEKEKHARRITSRQIINTFNSESSNPEYLCYVNQDYENTLTDSRVDIDWEKTKEIRKGVIGDIKSKIKFTKNGTETRRGVLEKKQTEGATPIDESKKNTESWNSPGDHNNRINETSPLELFQEKKPHEILKTPICNGTDYKISTNLMDMSLCYSNKKKKYWCSCDRDSSQFEETPIELQKMLELIEQNIQNIKNIEAKINNNVGLVDPTNYQNWIDPTNTTAILEQARKQGVEFNQTDLNDAVDKANETWEKKGLIDPHDQIAILEKAAAFGYQFNQEDLNKDKLPVKDSEKTYQKTTETDYGYIFSWVISYCFVNKIVHKELKKNLMIKIMKSFR